MRIILCCQTVVPPMPAIKRDNGVAVIRSGSAGVPMGIIFFIFGIFIHAVMLLTLLTGGTVTVNNRPVNSSMPAAWFPMLFPAIFWVGGLFVAIYSKNARCEIDDAGIRAFDWRGQTLTDIAWKEVTGYSLKPGKPP